MIAWDVILASLAVGCFVWSVVLSFGGIADRQKNRTRLFETVSQENITLPYTLKEKKWKKENPEELNKDRLAQQLVEAGIFHKSIYAFFRFAFRFVLFLPVILIGVSLFNNTFTLDTLTTSFFMGGILYFLLRYFIFKSRQKRKRALLRALPDYLDLLIICVESGLNFMSALSHTLKESDKNNPLAKELNVLYHEYLAGLPLSNACARMTRRCDMPEISSVLSSIAQSEKLGMGLGQTLRIQAVEFRDRYRQRIREKAFKIPVKLVFPVVLILGGAMMPLSCGPAAYRLMKSFTFFKEDQPVRPVQQIYEVPKNKDNSRR